MIDSLERFAIRWPFIAACVMTGALFAIVLSLISPVYETNDDVLISMIASGTGAGIAPDEHLVFSNVVIGFALKFLYTRFPAISWYGLYLVAVNLLANIAAIYSILSWRYRRTMVACFLLLFATASIQLIGRLQFTSTAVWSTQCGVFLIMTTLCGFREETRHKTVMQLSAGAGLMILGSLVRLESYLIVMAVSVVPCTYLLWKTNLEIEPRFRTWKIALLTLTFTQCAVFGLMWFNHAYYTRDAAWREFMAFNPYRVKFNDYGWTRFNAKTKWVFDRVDWSEHDHDLISKYWYFDDDQVFSREKLQSIVEGYPWGRSIANWRHFGKWWIEILRQQLLWALWAQIPLQIYFARNARLTLRHLFLVAVCIDLIVCGMMLLKAPVFRIYYPLFAFQPLMSLLFMRLEGTTAPKYLLQQPRQLRGFDWIGVDLRFRPRYLIGCLAILAMIGAARSTYRTHSLSRKTVAANSRMRDAITRLKPTDRDLYVGWHGWLPYEMILPLDSPNAIRQFHLLCLGWSQKSPINAAVKERFQIQNLAVDLRNLPNVYLVTTLDMRFDYERFLQEHYHLNLKWVPCFSSSTFSVWKPVPSPDPKSEMSQLVKPSKELQIQDDGASIVGQINSNIGLSR